MKMHYSSKGEGFYYAEQWVATVGYDTDTTLTHDNVLLMVTERLLCLEGETGEEITADFMQGALKYAYEFTAI